MPFDRKPYPAQAVANYFLDRAEEEGVSLTPMKLQKLVYFAHGWHLAYTGEPLIEDPVEAWRYGPVIPSLYKATKKYGRNPVEEKLTARTPILLDKEARVPSDDVDSRKVMNEIWRVYGKYSASRLSDITHMPGTPWYQTYEQHGSYLPRGIDIPKERIKKYFEDLYEEE